MLRCRAAGSYWAYLCILGAVTISLFYIKLRKLDRWTKLDTWGFHEFYLRSLESTLGCRNRLFDTEKAELLLSFLKSIPLCIHSLLIRLSVCMSISFWWFLWPPSPPHKIFSHSYFTLFSLVRNFFTLFFVRKMRCHNRRNVCRLTEWLTNQLADGQLARQTIGSTVSQKAYRVKLQ